MIDEFSPSLFWDVDRRKLSITDHAGFIIQRVCMLGNIGDYKLLVKNYGLEKIKSELLQARYLDKKTLNYFSIIFDIPKEKFRCYILQQSSPEHWNY
jgi:hypothetical protein